MQCQSSKKLVKLICNVELTVLEPAWGLTGLMSSSITSGTVLAGFPSASSSGSESDKTKVSRSAGARTCSQSIVRFALLGGGTRSCLREGKSLVRLTTSFCSINEQAIMRREIKRTYNGPGLKLGIAFDNDLEILRAELVGIHIDVES